MKLSATHVRNAKPADKPYKLTDGEGLYLLVKPNGGRYWRMDYRIHGRRKTLAMGTYPDVSLKQARERRTAAREQLADGRDPGVVRQAAKLAGADTFEAVAREWHEKYKSTWTEGHAKRVMDRLEKDVFPHLGREPIASLNAPALLQLLRRIERRGVLFTVHRIKQHLGQIFRYAIATGRAERDPSADLKGALAPVRSKHFASVKDPTAVGQLLRAIDGYQGQPTTRAALQLAPLVFVRPTELRHAEWSEITGDEWRIPAEKMKMRYPHIIPLSRQAREILDELRPLTGRWRYVFPSVRTHTRPMSENTVNGALRRLGYSKDEMTGHGFRSIASTLLNEQGWHPDAIERQLAHAERDETRRAYNYAEHLPERRRMMQAWADYLDGLRRGADVVPIRRGSA